MIRIGAHVSAAGGAIRAIANGEDLKCDTIQFFGASPQSWAAKLPLKKDAEAFRAARAKSRITSAYLHAAYLPNLGSANEITRARSVQNLSAHLKIAEALGVNGLIFHLGSSKDALVADSVRHTVSGMKAVLKEVPGDSFLIMENSAGGGDKLGYAASQVGELFAAVNSPRVKICFDTAHAFEAGIIENYEPGNVKKLFDEWDAAVGLENIVVFHVNDSKTAFASHHDRHENLGQGFIGLPGFKNLFKDKRLHNKDFILEVPGFEDLGPDQKNMELLRECAGLRK